MREGVDFWIDVDAHVHGHPQQRAGREPGNITVDRFGLAGKQEEALYAEAV